MSGSSIGWVAAVIAALAIAGCTKPEPEPTSVREPAVAAPELERVEYVDPLEAARAEAKRAAAERADPGDPSWREGFDHRQPEQADGAAAEPIPASDELAADAGNVEQPSAPPPNLEPTITDPLPSIDGLPPRDPEAAAKRPPDAMPPGR